MAGVLDRSVKRAVIAVLRLIAPQRSGSTASSAKPRSILVIRQHNQMGDMLCAVPLLRALRNAHEHARIVLMTSSANHEVMSGNRYLDDTVLYDKRMFLGKAWLRLGTLVSFIRTLRSMSFDQVIVPATVSMSFTSDLFAFLSGAPDRIGPESIDGKENPSGFVYTERVPLDWREEPHRHQTLRNLDIVRSRNVQTTDLSSEISLSKDERAEGKAFVSDIKKDGLPVIAYHPGAGKVPNQWPADRFSSLANHLAREWNSVTIITAGPMDAIAVQSMISGLRCRYQLLDNKTLRFVASVLAEVDLVISNDTGIMHVGGAVGTPVLSLFGPTDSGQWAPLGDMHRCLSGTGGKIDEISLDQVIETANGMLGRKRVKQ